MPSSRHDVADITEIETVRPALVTLTRDVRRMQADLLAGFDNRRAVLSWCQRLTVRTLGTLGDDFYRELSRQFRGSEEGVLLAAFLTPAARTRDLDEDVARELRERLLARRLDPAFRTAFRHLRKDAGEYIDEAGDGDAHDPTRQQHLAMRPSLTEIDEYQADALDRLLDGLADTSEILDWSKVLVLATHGEVERDFLARCYLEGSTQALLTGTDPVDRRGRELFAAYHLLPRFNAGVRDLAGRAGETADAETQTSEVEFA
jgi:hypothetical protein